jgi:hypothetical protein
VGAGADGGGDFAAELAVADVGDHAVAINFSGTWALDSGRSGSYNPFNIALGIPLRIRLIIGGLEIKKVIEHDPDGLRWVQHSVIGKHRLTKASPLDGKAQVEKHPYHNSMVSSTFCVAAGGAIESLSVYEGLGSRHTILRRLEDGGQTMHIQEALELRGGKRLHVDTYYTRAEGDPGIEGTTVPSCLQQ